MSTKVGRPRLGHTRKIVIPDDVYADLKVIAQIKGVPVAEVMRSAYLHYIHNVLKRRGAA